MAVTQRDRLIMSFLRSSGDKRKPPRDVTGAPTHLIPGYGDYQVTRGVINAMHKNPNEGVPRPRYGSQRAPYRPGERFKRKHPYKYGGADASRAHRPQVN